MIKKRNLDTSLVNYIDNLGMGMEARGALGGTVYYVEGNAGSDEMDGLSIDGAFKTLAHAITICHADMAQKSRWAKRNTIYIFGDTFTEDLVAFPQKTDIVGCGSYDANSMAGITGTHAPVNTAYGTRFFNVHFKGVAAANPIITLTSSTSGCQFIGCMFDGVVGTVTSGILATAHPNLRVVDCHFMGAFATSYISFGAGNALAPEILNNRMMLAAAAGIVVNSSTTSTYGGIIANNIIEAATLVIDDNSDTFFIANNHLISLAAQTAGYAEGLDTNAAQCVGNYFTATNVSGPWPILDTTT